MEDYMRKKNLDDDLKIEKKEMRNLVSGHGIPLEPVSCPDSCSDWCAKDCNAGANLSLGTSANWVGGFWVG